MRRLSAAIGRPVSFALTQHNHAPEAVARDAATCATEATPTAPTCARRSAAGR